MQNIKHKEYNPMKNARIEPRNEREKYVLNHLFNTGLSLFNAKEYKRALGLFEKAFSYCSSSIEAGYYAAQCQLRINMYECALPFMIRLGEILDERDISMYFRIFEAAEKTQKYRRLLNIQWAEYKYHFGNYEEAIEYCDRVLDKNSEDSEANRIKKLCITV